MANMEWLSEDTDPSLIPDPDVTPDDLEEEVTVGIVGLEPDEELEPDEDEEEDDDEDEDDDMDIEDEEDDDDIITETDDGEDSSQQV